MKERNMFNLKRALSLILIAALLLGLSACNLEGNNNDSDAGFGDDIPEVIFGTWHPHPEVSNIPVEIYSDGTCALDGQTVNWELESATEDDVVLAVGDAYLIFSNLRTSLPFLSVSNYGYCVKEPDLWNYMTDWHNPNTGGFFALSLEELANSGCNIAFNGESMTVEVLENDQITYIVEFSGAQAVITTPEGNSIVYYPTDDSGFAGDGNGDSNGDSDDPYTKYLQAVKDLESVLAGGYMTDYITSDGAHHVISGARAIENLYKTFLSLRNTMDVEEYLSCIFTVPNKLLKVYVTANGLDHVPNSNRYNCFGQLIEFRLIDTILFGEPVTYIYDLTGNISQVGIGGSVIGRPIFDAKGVLSELAVSVNDKEYIASIKYDGLGRIIQIDIPVGYSFNHVSENPDDFVETHKYIYGSNGELIQSTITKDLKDVENTFSYDIDSYYHKHGFTMKLLSEYHYNSNGKLIQQIQHEYAVDYTSGMDNWSYWTKSYEYDASGKCTSDRQEAYGITHPQGGEAYNYLFNNNGIVDSQNANIVEIWGDDLTYFDGNTFITEYEYGSIYIYSSED